MAEKTDPSHSDEDTSEDDDDKVIDSDSTPSPRFWHFSQLVEGNVYIGGGNIPTYKKKTGRARLTTTIEKFDVEQRIWQQLETKGDCHLGLTGVASASFGKYLFAFGGNNAGEGLNGVLSQLDLDTLTWSQLSPETADGPMRKDASGMVHFGEDSLAVMCGYATPKDRTRYNGGSSDHGSRFIVREGSSAEGDGWTNEMHVFNRKSKDGHPGNWTVFSFSGPRPPPCADFSLNSVDLYRAVLYGGRRGTDEDSNDFYLIDFNRKTITKIQPNNKKDKWPKMRLGHHAACCLGYNTDDPWLLISGGRIKHQLPPKDIWILNLATFTWKEVKLPDIQNQLGRWGHTFTAITHSEGLIEVIMFGGAPGYYEVTWDVYKGKDFRRLSLPISFILGFLDKEWTMLDIVDCNWPWTSKTTEMMPFDLESPIMLDVLYSMERDKIPVLTELIKNKIIRSTICSEDMEARFKWPTFTKPSFHEPTWENLIPILQLVKRNDLIKSIEQYFNKMKELQHRKAQSTNMAETSGSCGQPNIEIVLQDVEVCDRRTFEIIQSSTEPLEWEEYGLILYPQKDCLPPGVDKVTVNILASIAGRYVLPDGYHLVSSIFWLHCLPNCTFVKPIKLQMEHCANTNDPANLSFVKASTSSLPYSFKQLEGGQFFIKSDGIDYGTIELSQFCGVTVGQKGSNDRKYYGILFYLDSQTIHIALTWNESGHITKVRKEYMHARREGGEQEIALDSNSDSISLDIPMNGQSINGWKLVPLIYPKITKRQMDEFEIGQGTPSFQLQILVSDPISKRKGLTHHLVLQGAKFPRNVFTVIISAEAPRKRLLTAGDVEDAERPRIKLQHQKKYHSADFEGAPVSHLLNTSGDLAEEEEYIAQQAGVKQSFITNVMQLNCKLAYMIFTFTVLMLACLVAYVKLGDSSRHGSGSLPVTAPYPESPTLPLLQNLNGLYILQEIGADYRKFGTAILNDQKGTNIEKFEHDCNHQSDCINGKIATKWLNGHRDFQDTTWSTLISVLCQIEKRNLAVQISNKLQISLSHSC